MWHAITSRDAGRVLILRPGPAENQRPFVTNYVVPFSAVHPRWSTIGYPGDMSSNLSKYSSSRGGRYAFGPEMGRGSRPPLRTISLHRDATGKQADAAGC